jgi:ribonucleoside-diphosphate reductase alpha chain
MSPRFERMARDACIWTNELRARVLASGRVRDIADIPAGIRSLFPTAHEISAEHHIRLQAACQAHVDNAVSKTVNLPSEATADQVVKAFRTAFELGCKGITVYRHGAKPGQVLSPISSPGLCPDCRNALEFAEGATLCRVCGFSSGA